MAYDVPPWYPKNLVNATCGPVTIAQVHFRPSPGANSDGRTALTLSDGTTYVMYTSTTLHPGDKGASCFPGHDHEPGDTLSVMVFGKLTYLMRATADDR